MNVNKFLNDPTIKSNQLLDNRFQPFITDEYAFSYLLKGRTFPKGVIVHSFQLSYSENQQYDEADYSQIHNESQLTPIATQIEKISSLTKFKYQSKIVQSSTNGLLLNRVQRQKILEQKTMTQKLKGYAKEMGQNYSQVLMVQMRKQGLYLGSNILRNSDDGETIEQFERNYQNTKMGIKGINQSSKTLRKAVPVAKKIPVKLKKSVQQVNWWKGYIHQWWHSGNKVNAVQQIIFQGIKKIFANPVVAIKGIFISLIPLGIILAILAIISALAVMMGAGVAQSEIELTKAWEEVSLNDYNETAEIRKVDKPTIDGSEVLPESVSIYSNIDDFLIYMNVKFEDYTLDKAISKKNSETHRAFLNNLYHKVVVNNNPSWKLKNFEEVIQQSNFRLGKKESRYELIKKQNNPYFDYQELINPFNRDDKNASINVNKRYGYYYQESGIFHKAFRSGIFVEASKGQAVYAPKAGKIRYSGSTCYIETSSKQLRIDNLTSFRVNEGQKVKRGTLIGNVSKAGGVYIEYKKRQKILWVTVNPAFYFPNVNYVEKTTYEVATTLDISGDIGQRALQVYNLFKKYFPQTTINGASAFLGNFQVESGINPKTAEGYYLSPPVGATATSWDDDNWLNMSGMDIYGNNTMIIHRGLGLGQFTDTKDGSRRNTLLRQYAKSKGKKWYDLELQIEFMLMQDTPYYQAIVRKVLSSNDLPSKLANEVLVFWEGNPGNKVAERQASAISWAKYLQNPPKVGKYAHAIPNAPISSPFGWRSFGGISEFHRGIDYAVPQGTPIHAIADGVVIVAEYHYSWGNHVQIKHADGTSSNYAHQSRINVHVGQSVKQGDVLGFVGSTGNSTGPHLHLEISRSTSLAQSELIDPVTVLGK